MTFEISSSVLPQSSPLFNVLLQPVPVPTQISEGSSADKTCRLAEQTVVERGQAVSTTDSHLLTDGD